MAMTLTQLITEVQALTGREDDTVLITQARVIRFLNDAQDEIAKVCLGHIDLETKDADAITLATGVYSYSFSAISPAVFHLLAAYYMDGISSEKMFYRDTEDFDTDYPDPSIVSGIPCEWTRRGSSIEVWPLPDSGSNGKYIRLDYTKTPTAFSIASLSATCDMTYADKGLIYYAVSEAFRAIGGHQSEADDYKKWFFEWLEGYRQQKDGRYMSETMGLI